LPGGHNKLLGPGNLVDEELFLVDRDHGSPIAANDQAARDRGDGSLMVAR